MILKNDIDSSCQERATSNRLIDGSSGPLILCHCLTVRPP